ncbi:hypothetical protein EPN42_01250 [bacterium]|nr:MAG: hypothetical protein EPN42_01250 [bacterium]
MAPILKVHFLTNRRAAQAAIDYITDDHKALGQRYWNLPHSTLEAAAVLERERWRSAREGSLLHVVLAFPDGASIDVASAFTYLRALLTYAGLASQQAMAAAHAGRPHLHCILSRVDPRGRLLPLRIHELVARNRELAARYAWSGTRDRERPLPADIVNAETWEGHLSFTRYLRGLPWPEPSDPDPSRAVDALLARVGVTRVRVGAGWRLERIANGHTYRAKASVAIPADLRRVLVDPEPTRITVEPNLTYETLRSRGTLVLPPVRTHVHYPQAQVEQARSAKGLGYWLRRMQPLPSTWTAEDRIPMIVLTRPATGGPWRCVNGIDDTAGLAELARRLDATPHGFLDSPDPEGVVDSLSPDHQFIVAPNPLAARALAALIDQHALMPMHNGLTVALGGTLDAPLVPEWSQGDNGDPRHQLSAPGSPKPFRLDLDAPWSHHGPWFVLTAPSQNSLLERATEIWNQREQLGAIPSQRLATITRGITPVDRPLERPQSERTPLNDSPTAPATDRAPQDAVAPGHPPIDQPAHPGQESLSDIIAPGESPESADHETPNVIAPAAEHADSQDGAGATLNGAPHANRIPDQSETRTGPLPKGADPLLALWERYLRGCGLSDDRIDQLLKAQRDAIAGRAAALSSMHRMGATDFASRLRAISKLAPVLTLADGHLAIARAETGIPFLDPSHFAFAPPEEYRDAVRALPLRTALGLQKGNALIGMDALALHSLAPATLVTLPNPDDPRGAQLNGFAVADEDTRSTTTVLYDPRRGYVFDRSAPAYAKDALRYAILLAATQDDGAITLSGTREFQERVAHLAIDLGITVTNDRHRIARLEQEAQTRLAHHPTRRTENAYERALAAAHDLGIAALNPATCQDQRLTVLAVGSATAGDTLTLATTSNGQLLAAPLPANKMLLPGKAIDVSRRDGQLLVLDVTRDGSSSERDRGDALDNDGADDRRERRREVAHER